MREEKRNARKRQIENAVYQLLAEKGFSGTSMLAVAKQANCSNETLYNWYGDKLGLIRSMVTSNADTARQLLEKALAENRSPGETLRSLGPVLLNILLGEKAVALNRAAAADPTGELGKALSEAGRESILPLVVQLIGRLETLQDAKSKDPAKTAELYLSLLIGDLQIRRVIGRVPPLSDSEIKARSDSAVAHLFKLLS